MDRLLPWLRRSGWLYGLLALVSAGRGNPYGHSWPSVLGAIAASGAAALRTDRGGDIDVRPGPSGIVVSRG